MDLFVSRKTTENPPSVRPRRVTDCQIRKSVINPPPQTNSGEGVAPLGRRTDGSSRQYVGDALDAPLLRGDGRAELSGHRSIAGAFIFPR